MECIQEMLNLINIIIISICPVDQLPLHSKPTTKGVYLEVTAIPLMEIYSNVFSHNRSLAKVKAMYPEQLNFQICLLNLG